ncbi:hypothetical protein ACFW56_23640 [Nocardiopsis dassonvillei]|uniref:hypothetical protein n=1 Tax=Nocardiopsis dassonvillei TaxID=2014 RepID=UPI0036725966
MGQAQGALQVHGRVEQGVAGNPGIGSASLKDGDEQVARQDDPVEGLVLGAGIVVDVPDCGQMRQGTTQVLLRHDSERHWMRAAPARVRHLFPRLPSQPEYNRHLRVLAPALLHAARWPTRATPSWHEKPRLMDGAPVRCGASRVTANRSGLGEIAGYGMDTSHHASSWGVKLMLITTAEGSVRAFSLAHPKEPDERKQALHLLHVHQCAPWPCPLVCDKGFAGVGIERAAAGLGHVLVRPRRKDESPPGFPRVVAPADRSDHLDVEEPARVGTPSGSYDRRALGQDVPEERSAQRGDLAQLAGGRPGQAVADRLRPLTRTHIPHQRSRHCFLDG